MKRNKNALEECSNDYKKAIVSIPKEWVERYFTKLVNVELTDKEKLEL